MGTRRRLRDSQRATVLLGPFIAGDGTAKAVDLRNKDAAAVAGVLQAMRDVTSGRVRRFRRPVSSRVPSVQGLWDPSNTFDNFELRESSSHLASGEGAGTRSSAHEGGVPVAVGEQQQQQQQQLR